MRLIDADALKKQMCNECFGGNCGHRCLEWNLMNDAPTVDAVEVVRCKDCRFFEDEDEDGDCWCYCHNDITCRDGYCSWGERREDETG